jgi:hypothetical protein
MSKQLIDYFKSNQQLKQALFYSSQIASNLDEIFDVIALAIHAAEYEIAHEYINIAQHQVRMHEDKTKVDKYALELALKTEQFDSALENAWAIFEATQKIEDYKYLETLHLKLKQDISVLLAKSEKVLLSHVKVIGTKKQSSYAMRAIENLIEFYLYSEQTDKALSLSKQYELAPDTMQEVAFASLTKRPKASFNLYRQLCLLYPQLGTHKDYETCIELLKELDFGLKHDDIMSEKFNHLLAELADMFRHKEAFIVMMDNAFPNLRG